MFSGLVRRAYLRTKATTAVVGCCAAVLAVPSAPAAAQSSTCVGKLVRAGAHNAYSSQTSRDLNGVKARVVIPLTSSFRNVTSDTDFSVGDLYSVIDDTYFDFVQFGWNYGYTDNAHGFEAVVHPFIGEYTGPGTELLKFAFSVTLTPGSAHTFELRRNEDLSSNDYGKWFGFIDGVALMKTTYAHWGGYVGTVGEVNRRCHGMQNSNFEVSSSGSYLPTLKARRRSTGLWYTWAEHYNESNDSCYVATRYMNGSTPVNSTALDYSTFASGCPQN